MKMLKRIAGLQAKRSVCWSLLTGTEDVPERSLAAPGRDHFFFFFFGLAGWGFSVMIVALCAPGRTRPVHTHSHNLIADSALGHSWNQVHTIVFSLCFYGRFRPSLVSLNSALRVSSGRG